LKDRLKMLKRIRAARERIRDAAAAEFAVADAERERVDSRKRDAEEARKEIVRESGHRLKIAAHIAEIEILGIELGGADDGIRQADHALNEATKKSEKAAGLLRGCERQLRLSERLVLETRKEVSKVADKNEQAMVDDIIASRWSKTE
jgi:flagellar export protein FliJ